MKKKKHIITEAVVAAAKEWQAQPSAKAIMSEARARCKAIKSLKTIAAEKGIEFWALHKYIFRTIHK